MPLHMCNYPESFEKMGRVWGEVSVRRGTIEMGFTSALHSLSHLISLLKYYCLYVLNYILMRHLCILMWKKVELSGVDWGLSGVMWICSKNCLVYANISTQNWNFSQYQVLWDCSPLQKKWKNKTAGLIHVNTHKQNHHDLVSVIIC